jgi:hypothetical protein
LRWLLHGWFALICASTLTTWQHHFIDLPAGALVGVIAFWLFPDPSTDGVGKTVAYRPLGGMRLARRYLLGALACLALALQGGYWLLSLWPGFALGVVGIAYMGVGPAVFRKRGGRLSISAKLLLGPYLIGQALSWRWYLRRMGAPLSEIVPGVFIGARLDDRDAIVFAAAHPRRFVLDLTGDFDESGSLREGDYTNLQLMDLTEPPPEALRDAATCIEVAHRQGKTVFVHCALGYSRSAQVVAHWLAVTGRAGSLREALERVRAARPGVVVARNFPTAFDRPALAQESA